MNKPTFLLLHPKKSRLALADDKSDKSINILAEPSIAFRAESFPEAAESLKTPNV